MSAALLALLVQIVVPAYGGGITVDPQAPANKAAGLTAAPNGVPVVNIATPNAAGLSSNQFLDFNVGTNGVILNNSAAFGQSKLGGLILGNPNLQTGPSARLILNEVTGTNPSQLLGYTEIFGSSAEYILANPNGITCNGCGFINTPRATLTTGVPTIDPATGQLKGFSVTQGVVTVGELGLDASTVDTFDIVSRAAQINGSLFGNDVGVFAGQNDFNYAQRVATAKAPDGSAKPQFGIDSSLLGGMYANRITLVGTEAGVGVRVPTNVAANSGDLTVTADGTLILNNAQAAGAIVATSKSGGVQVAGDVRGDNSLTIAGKQDVTVESGAVASAGGDVAVTGQNVAVTLNAVMEAHQEWDHESQGLSGPAAAVIAIAVIIATEGAGAELLVALGTTEAAVGAVGAAALQAAIGTLASQATLSLIDNQGNLGAVFKDLGSSADLRQLATSVATAGLTADLAGSVDSIVQSEIDAGVSTAINGGNLGRTLLTGLVTGAVQEGAALGANELHDVFVQDGVLGSDAIGDLSDPLHLLAHAGLGCAVGAISGQCGAGAIGGVVGEFTAETLLGSGLSDQRIIGASKLTAALVAFATGQSATGVNTAANAGENAAKNNAGKGPGSGAPGAEVAAGIAALFDELTGKPQAGTAAEGVAGAAAGEAAAASTEGAAGAAAKIDLANLEGSVTLIDNPEIATIARNDGTLGEQAAAQLLQDATGITFVPIQNASGNGIDLVGIDEANMTILAPEVKSSTVGSFPNPDSLNLVERTEDWINQVADSGKINGQELSDADKAFAEQLQAPLEKGFQIKPVVVNVNIPQVQAAGNVRLPEPHGFIARPVSRSPTWGRSSARISSSPRSATARTRRSSAWATPISTPRSSATRS
jgi:filamentous hemagglutinin family protein